MTHKVPHPFILPLTMYGYGKLVEILPEQVLQKVSELQIFEWVFDHSIDVLQHYVSPFRSDTTPNCRFETRPDGALLFIDFGDKKTHRSCFQAVMDKYPGTTFNDALKLILQHFGLSNDPIDYEPVKQVYVPSSDSPHDNSHAAIHQINRGFERRDALYWSQFLIQLVHLAEDDVRCVERVTIDNPKKRKVTFSPFGLCYSFNFGDHVKLYQPNNNPKYKWITNCDENDIGNIGNLPRTGKELIIQKSYKDHRVLRNMNLGLDVIWTQNEGCVPRADILLDLSQRFELITIFYDNDQPGREAAAKLMTIILTINPGAKVRCIHLPVRKYHHKDPGEFVKKEGRRDLIEVLHYIGINPKN